MELMLLGVNFLLGYAIWRYMWRKTALDKYRDRLFDLRDEVKLYFLSQGYSLDNKLYIELRALINGHIRYTEKLTLNLFLAETVAMSAHPEIAKSIRKEVNQKFVTDDPKLSTFINDVRARSISILTGHMAESSFGFIVFFPFMYLIAVLFKIFTMLKAFVKNHNAQIISGIRVAFKFAPIVGFMLAIPARAGLLDKTFDANIVEEYSFKSGHR